MATHASEEATISIPSLVFVGVLLFFSYRYFFASASTSSSSASSRSRANGLRFTAAQVEQVSAMFPQLNRRDIMWDLHRNRGSVQATTERVLMGRGLDPAPPSFQPPITFPSATGSTPVGSSSSAQARKNEIDLITRYNLQSKVSGKGKEKEEESPAPGWQQDKAERAKMLQRRRDEMILAARRKMQEKDAAKEEAAGGAAGVGAQAGAVGS